MALAAKTVSPSLAPVFIKKAVPVRRQTVRTKMSALINIIAFSRPQSSNRLTVVGAARLESTWRTASKATARPRYCAATEAQAIPSRPQPRWNTKIRLRMTLAPLITICCTKDARAACMPQSQPRAAILHSAAGAPQTRISK